jgi:hypothetical protein
MVIKANHPPLVHILHMVVEVEQVENMHCHQRILTTVVDLAVEVQLKKILVVAQ